MGSGYSPDSEERHQFTFPNKDDHSTATSQRMPPEKKISNQKSAKYFNKYQRIKYNQIFLTLGTHKIWFHHFLHGSSMCHNLVTVEPVGAGLNWHFCRKTNHVLPFTALTLRKRNFKEWGQVIVCLHCCCQRQKLHYSSLYNTSNTDPTFVTAVFVRQYFT